jgi:hypothetical protein
MRLSDDARMFGRFARDLGSFLRQTMSLDQARTLVQQRFAAREASFLRLVTHGIFKNPRSPYVPLLHLAGCELADLQTMVRDRGLEPTLQALRDAGVYVSFEEFKGRQPIVRHGREFAVQPRDFDNPHRSFHYQTESGGSTGAGTRVSHDLEHLADLAPHYLLTRDMHGVLEAPTALWRGVLPDGSGINNILMAARFGQMPARWFAVNVSRAAKPAFKYRLATSLTVMLSRLAGRPIPWPEQVGLDQARTVAQWAAETLRTHGACLLMVPVSRALRVCLAARDAGLDLSGATFIVAGEPLTPAKIQGIEQSGARYFPTYGLSETGRLGMGCGHPTALDDVHLLTDAFGIITHPYTIPGTETTVPALNITSLLPTAPKICLNVEIDDYGVVEQRSCGCSLEAYGFSTHLHHIRSYRKLTGEGVTLIGSDMLTILEDLLPARFGGSPLDYQLLEEEDQDGFTRLSLLVHPSIRLDSETAVIETVLTALQQQNAAADSARDVWSQARALRVKRMAPIWTARGKLLPLHLLKNDTSAT